MLRNISVRTPGGTVIQAQQANSESMAKEDQGTMTLDWDQQRNLAELIENLTNQLDLNAQQTEELRRRTRQEIEKAWSAAGHFEFLYLQRFLLPHTTYVLWYIHSQQGQMTREFFCSAWPGFNFGTETEREAVLNALQSSGLLQQMENMLAVTHKGRSFLRFAGLIPSEKRG